MLRVEALEVHFYCLQELGLVILPIGTSPENLLANRAGIVLAVPFLDIIAMKVVIVVEHAAHGGVSDRLKTNRAILGQKVARFQLYEHFLDLKIGHRFVPLV